MDNCRFCDNCQWTGNLVLISLAKLITMLPIEPFTKWGIDFISPIKPIGCYTNKCYVLVVINYTSKQVEAKVLQANTRMVMARFLYKFILTQFDYPLTLVSDQGVHFINDTIQTLTMHFLFKHTSSTTYYPQKNGQTKLTNKVISLLLNKLVNEMHNDWDEHYT
jgi:hypothetical protein